MPKLRLIDRKIAGETVRLELWYDSRVKFFTIKGLPDRVQQLAGHLTGTTTEAELEKLLDELIARYHEAIQTEVQLIVVSFCAAQASRAREVYRDGWGSRWIEDEDFPKKFVKMGYHYTGRGFLLDFKRVTKFTGEHTRYYAWSKTEAGEWRQHNSYSHSHEMANAMEIPYTPERYAFFEAVDELLRSQALRIAQFLNQDLETLTSLIEEKSPLKLLTAPEP